jgi:hypothetical protein
MTPQQSEATVAVIFQITKFAEIGMPNPRGNVQITPAPMVAGVLRRRKKFVGAPGCVVHAKQAVVTDAAALALSDSAKKLTGLVGVTPFEDGRPKPQVLAVPVFCEMPISMICGLLVDAEMRDHAELAIVVLLVRCESE